MLSDKEKKEIKSYEIIVNKPLEIRWSETLSGQIIGYSYDEEGAREDKEYLLGENGDILVGPKDDEYEKIYIKVAHATILEIKMQPPRDSRIEYDKLFKLKMQGDKRKKVSKKSLQKKQDLNFLDLLKDKINKNQTILPCDWEKFKKIKERYDVFNQNIKFLTEVTRFFGCRNNLKLFVKTNPGQIITPPRVTNFQTHQQPPDLSNQMLDAIKETNSKDFGKYFLHLYQLIKEQEEQDNHFPSTEPSDFSNQVLAVDPKYSTSIPEPWDLSNQVLAVDPKYSTSIPEPWDLSNQVLAVDPKYSTSIPEPWDLSNQLLAVDPKYSILIPEPSDLSNQMFEEGTEENNNFNSIPQPSDLSNQVLDVDPKYSRSIPPPEKLPKQILVDDTEEETMVQES